MAFSPNLFLSDVMRPYLQLAGDELLGCMRVSKSWHQEILTNEKRRIEEKLKALFEAVFSVLLKNPKIILNDYYFNFFEKKLDHPAFQIRKATALPQIDKKIHLALLSLAKETHLFLKIPKNSKEQINQNFFKEIEDKKPPTTLFDHFKFTLKLKQGGFSNICIKTVDEKHENRAIEVLKLIKDKSIAGTCFSWKIKILKKFSYNKITKAAFKYVAEELAKKGFYNSVIRLAASPTFGDVLGLPFLEDMFERATPMQRIEFIQTIQDPVLKGELLLIRFAKKTEKLEGCENYADFIFDTISVLSDGIYFSNPEGISSVIHFLIKVGNLEQWKFNHLIEKSILNLAFFKVFIPKLVEDGFFDRAIEVLQKIDTSKAAGKFYHTKAIKFIMVKAIEVRDYDSALKAAQCALDTKFRETLLKELEIKKTAS